MNAIKVNIESLGLDGKINVLKMDAIRAINGIYKDMKFDYIFLDPPYRDYHLLNDVLEIICINELLSDVGTIIIEENTDYELNENLFKDDFDIDTRTIGDKKIFFIKRC